jgi:hypothetical protein
MTPDDEKEKEEEKKEEEVKELPPLGVSVSESIQSKDKAG